ncbi:MAG: hypothetical protein JXR76_23790 [Deltaproteobacteria bacterium]|nr:hypothetical protein [Deltaproteobacteria bacterium]
MREDCADISSLVYDTDEGDTLTDTGSEKSTVTVTETLDRKQLRKTLALPVPRAMLCTPVTFPKCEYKRREPPREVLHQALQAPPLADEDVKEIVETTAYRVIRMLKQRGVLTEDAYDDFAQEHSLCLPG